MKFPFLRLSSRWVAVAVALLVVGVAWGMSGWWWPAVRNRIARSPAEARDHMKSHTAEAGHDEHAGHGHEGHDHAGHEESSSLELSPQARRTIGLKTGEVRLGSYDRAISVPALVVERPGLTKTLVAAPLTGIVTGVYAVKGETVTSGDLLFTLRLTHEDLVRAQAEYLRTLGQLDVEQRELRRLEQAAPGAISQKTLLERRYAIEKLEIDRNAQHEALLLHGLSDEQVDAIARSRKLLRELKVFAPLVHDDLSLHSDAEQSHAHSTADDPSSAPTDSAAAHNLAPQQFVIEMLNVQRGAAVTSGDPLCVLADYRELYVEGQAFEQDAAALSQAAQQGSRVSAVLEDDASSAARVEGLEIVYVANEVDLESRALHFYVRLPNSVARDMEQDGRHFVTWRFKPGQRMQLRVPVERWENVIVLPVDALAQDGPETYVFTENGDHFDRRPVHVQYRDQFHAVLANDGSLFPGETIALNGAHQLQMALRNKSGGAVDPHAGHHH